MTGLPPSARLTGQQAEAVWRRDVSVVLSSGAGCGKTHVLTERYLSHLREPGVEVGQVVAITFTERAARQMRGRIRQALTGELRRPTADAERWARHLRGLESAPISTIHAFCGALLRQHAAEAGLDPRFEVLEDVLAANLQADALTECLQRLLTADASAGEDLRQSVLLYGWKPTLAAVQGLLRAEDAPAWQDWLSFSSEQVVTRWQGYARDELLPRFARHVLGTGKVGYCLKLLRRVEPVAGSQMAGRVRHLLELVPGLPEAADPAAVVDELCDCAKVGGERARAWPSEEAYEQAKEAFEGFREELADRLKPFIAGPGEVVDTADAAVRLLRVSREAAQTYQAHKRRHGVVDFQDLLVRTRDLLRDHVPVRERLQRRYHAVLIDEVQDTDPVQGELVEYLCGGGLTRGKLFAVGDHKQSIYRFRGADVHRFRDLRRRVPHEGRLDLTVNFRSQPAILDFTNALLGGHLDDYQPLVAHHPQLNPGPCVEFLWSPRGDRESVGEARAREADWIARRVRALLDPEPLVADESRTSLRPVRPGDVVLLFRSMSNVALYEAALRRHGLDYYLVGGRAFFAQQEIYDLLNLLRALENPQDALSLAGTLRSPFCCLSDEALFLLGRAAGGLWVGLNDPAVRGRLPEDDRAAAERAQRLLHRWRGLKDRLPISRLLGEVFADSGYDAATQFEFLGDRKLANLWKLTELARAFDRSGLFGLAEFIQRLAELVQAQPREEQAATQPENAAVVRLMTIHQAKGLEFPVVIVPDCAATPGGSRPPVAQWDARLGCVVRPPADETPPPFSDFAWEIWKAGEAVEEWHEELRTLYVACTRAQDYLVLSAALPRPFKPVNAWMTTLTERFDVTTGACRAAGTAPDHVPRVRVTDDRSPPPVGAAPRPPDREGAAAANLAPGLVAPVHPRAAGKKVFTTWEIENYLARRGGDRCPPPLAPADLAPQFDREDGADRTEWVSPREGVAAQADVARAAHDRVSRRVLGEWDFRDPEGWRPALREALAAAPGLGGIEALTPSLEAVFAALATSPTFRALAGAAVVYRDVEFVDPLGGPGVAVRGMIDCLWQGLRQDWHLLAYATEPVPPGGRGRDWARREPGLALAARSVSRRWGAWPRTVTLCYVTDAAAVSRPVSRWPRAPVLAAVARAVTEILGQPLEDG
jgi:ATP-dependent helicase/nuclease subunit A